MKPLAPFRLLVLAGLLAACAQPATQAPVTATQEPITPTPEIFMPVPDEGRAQDAAREALARHLGVDLAAIVVRKIVDTEWPDSCLGLTIADQACQIGSVAGFRIVLDVGDATYEVRTDRRSQTVLIAGRVDSTLGELPAVCQGIGQATYYAPENRFCFAYPASFTPGDQNPTGGEIVGPPLDGQPDDARVTLHLEIRPMTTGEDLSTIVDAYVTSLEPQAAAAVTRTPLTLGGQPAEQVAVMPEGAGARAVFMVRDAVLYHFLFTPAGQANAQTPSTVDDLFLTVTSSFTFLAAP
jgi:hypothetical protein